MRSRIILISASRFGAHTSRIRAIARRMCKQDEVREECVTLNGVKKLESLLQCVNYVINSNSHNILNSQSERRKRFFLFESICAFTKSKKKAKISQFDN